MDRDLSPEFNAAIVVPEATRGKLLTIYILAYENAEFVGPLLESILPIQSNDVCVVVSDNSDRTNGVRECVSQFMRSHSNVRYVTYGTNLELGGLIRAFEVVESTYVWMVGASGSLLTPDALSTLIPILAADRPDLLLHYENNLWRNKEIAEKRHYRDFLSIMRDHSFSILGSINSLVYRTQLMRQYARNGFRAMSMMMPHTAMVYAAMRDGSVSMSYYPIKILVRLPRNRAWSEDWLVRSLHALLPWDASRAEIEQFFNVLSDTDPYFVEWGQKKGINTNLIIAMPWRRRAKRKLGMYAARLKKIPRQFLSFLRQFVPPLAWTWAKRACGRSVDAGTQNVIDTTGFRSLDLVVNGIVPPSIAAIIRYACMMRARPKGKGLDASGA